MNGMMNQQTNMTNFLSFNIESDKVNRVFEEYNVVSSYPINREHFIKDVLKSAILDKVYVFDREGACVNVEISF